MVLNDAGIMVERIWNEIPDHYPGFKIDVSVVMPDHFHGIVQIVGDNGKGAGDIVEAGPRACLVGINDNITNGNGLELKGHPRGSAPTTGSAPTETGPRSLPDIVHRFKTMTTKKYADGVKQNGWRPFPGRLWQRNYYEHIVRNGSDWNRIRQYIITNPLKWHLDENQAIISNAGFLQQDLP